MFIDIRFTEILKVESGKRCGLRLDVTARADGGGCFDKNEIKQLRSEIFEAINSRLPNCIKEKGAAK